MADERPLNAVLGKGAAYEGNLSFEGRVRLDGLFRGRIFTDDVLEVGSEGRVEGELDVARLVLAGTCVGKIRVRDLLIVESTGFIDGEVVAPRMEVRPGARFDATLRVGLD